MAATDTGDPRARSVASVASAAPPPASARTVEAWAEAYIRTTSLEWSGASDVLVLGDSMRMLRTTSGRNPGWYGRSVQSSSRVVANTATRPSP